MSNRIPSLINSLLCKSDELSSGQPAVRRLHTQRITLHDNGKIRRWTFGQKRPNDLNKTILLLGETGTGKTTLINTMANYYLGVKFDDKVWFEITEEEKRDQTESKTSEITEYEIFSEQESFSLTIIDTPGFGDTRGIDKDMEIPQNLNNLFLHDTGVKNLDAVCLVLKASESRISDRLHYIFEGVLSLFGKDIEDIIMLFITHSDGGLPTNALEVIEKENIPCCHNDKNEPVHFLFNNRHSEKHTAKYQRVIKSSWEMGEASLGEFFEFLNSRKSKSLALTLSVLQERIQLEACVQSLKEYIKFTESKNTELTQIQVALRQNKDKIMENETVSFSVTKVYKEKVPITRGSWVKRKVTACSECQQNCHRYCSLIGSSGRCKLLKDDFCTVCGCPRFKHVREEKKYKTKEEKTTVTFAELKELFCKEGSVTYDTSKYQQVETEHQVKLRNKEQMTNMESNLKVLLAENETQKRNSVKNAYEAIIKLSVCALKAQSAFTLQHLDFLIPRLEEAGEAEAAQKLKDMQKHLHKKPNYSALSYMRGLRIKMLK